MNKSWKGLEKSVSEGPKGFKKSTRRSLKSLLEGAREYLNESSVYIIGSFNKRALIMKWCVEKL